MKARLLSMALLSVCGHAMAAERAVEQVNFEVAVKLAVYEFSSDKIEDEAVGVSEALSAELSFPLGPYFGASLGGIYENDNGFGEFNDSEYDTEAKTFAARANVFFRLPQIGRVSFGYERERTKYQTSYDNNYGGYYYLNDITTTVTTTSYLGLVEGYIGPITLALHDTRDREQAYSGDKVDYARAVAQWYVIPNVRVGAQVGFKDAKDTYVLDAEFQPSDFLGLNVSYVRSEQYHYEDNMLRLSVNFYFNSRVDLKTRDRSYR